MTLRGEEVAIGRLEEVEVEKRRLLLLELRIDEVGDFEVVEIASLARLFERVVADMDQRG